jgi:hypothetical protein
MIKVIKVVRRKRQLREREAGLEMVKDEIRVERATRRKHVSG